MQLQLKYIKSYTVNGTLYCYYRRNGTEVAIEGEPGSAKFLSNYNRIHAGFEVRPRKQQVDPESFEALIVKYLKSADFAGIADNTKKTYRVYLDTIRTAFGPHPVKSIKREHVMALRDKLADKPSACNSVIRLTARLFTFAIDRGWLEHNPAQRIKNLKTGEHRPWTDAETAAVIENAPKDIAHAVIVGLYTGQRFGDCIKMAWTDIQDGGINLRQQKTGKELFIPLHPDLQQALPSIPKNGVTILTDNRGRSWTHDTFQHRFRTAVKNLNLDVVYHGLRKTAAVKLAESGCTDEEIKSITGHTSSQVLAHYTKGARQKHLAKAAILKLTGNKSV